MPRDSEIFMLTAPILNKRTSLFLSRRNLKEVAKFPQEIISIRGLVQLISRSTVLPIREGPWIENQGTALWLLKFIILSTISDPAKISLKPVERSFKGLGQWSIKPSILQAELTQCD
jgi:hypothetical protein